MKCLYLAKRWRALGFFAVVLCGGCAVDGGMSAASEEQQGDDCQPAQDDPIRDRRAYVLAALDAEPQTVAYGSGKTVELPCSHVDAAGDPIMGTGWVDRRTKCQNACLEAADYAFKSQSTILLGYTELALSRLNIDIRTRKEIVNTLQKQCFEAGKFTMACAIETACNDPETPISTDFKNFVGDATQFLSVNTNISVTYTDNLVF